MIGNAEEPTEPLKVPSRIPNLPGNFIPRLQDEDFEGLLNAILDKSCKEHIAITGTGGYGKTTLAKEICQNERIKEAFPNGILWIDLGKKPFDLLAEIKAKIHLLNGEYKEEFETPDVVACFAELLDRYAILLVIDDVQNKRDLDPFLQGGKENCVRLITARNEHMLPSDISPFPIRSMNEDVAVVLLAQGIKDHISSAKEWRKLHALTRRLGQWPILLNVVNGFLRRWIRHHHGQISGALEYINQELDSGGLLAFDEDKAIATILEASFTVLESEKKFLYDLYRCLAIFPENIAIPLATVYRFWSQNYRFNEIKGYCMDLAELSLLDLNLREGYIRLHNIFHIYLQQSEKENLQAYHQQLLNSYQCQNWADLPINEPYLWEHLAEHLIGAKQSEDLVVTVMDGNYLAAKIYKYQSSYSVEMDIHIAIKQASISDSTSATLHLLKRNIARISHLLRRCKNQNEVVGVLHSRLSYLPELSSVWDVLAKDTRQPFLTSQQPFMDLSDPSLIRTLGPVCKS